MNNSINYKKIHQRKLASINRLKIAESGSKISIKLIDELLNKDFFKKLKVISSFISIRTEISTKNLNNQIIKSNKLLCLPLIINNNNELHFAQYKKGDILKEGKYGIKEPEKNNFYLPDIVIIPCLAFDLNGYRLGYGGGYYDKTLSYFNYINHDFISVALAYDDQKVDQVARDKFDYKLNYILTEKRLYEIL